MSDALVGSVQTLPTTKLVHAKPGSVLAVLRNGRVIRVISSGQRVGKFFRGPGIGDFQVIEVNTGWITVNQTIANVRSAADDGIEFHAASLTATITAQLNPGSEYGDLKRLINDAGLGLADALVRALTSAIERELRGTFSRGSHKFWYSASLTHEFAQMFPVGQAFGPVGYKQLIIAKSVDNISVAWDPDFLMMRGAGIAIAISPALAEAAAAAAQVTNAGVVALAEGKAQVAAVEAKARLELLQQVQAVAAVLGMPPVYFTDPGSYEALLGRQHELALELMKPHNQGLLYRRPDLFALIASQLGMPMPGSAQAAEPSWQATMEPPEPAALAPAGSLSAAGPDLELSINARLRRWWQTERPGDEILGIVVARRQNSAAIAVVLDGPPPDRADLTALERSFAVWLDIPRVTIACAQSGTPSDVLAGLAASVAPLLASQTAISAKIRDEPDGEQLVITLASRSGAAGQLRDQLTAPEPPLLAAINELVSFESVLVDVDLT